MGVKNKRVKKSVKSKKSSTEKKAQSKHKPIWEEILEIMADVPEEELKKFPSDLSVRLDDYLYGSDDSWDQFVLTHHTGLLFHFLAMISI